MSNGSSINVNLDIGAILRKKRERDLGQKLLGATEGILSSEEQTVLKGSTREEIYQYIQAKSVMATGQAKTQEAELYKRIQNLPQFQNMAGVSPQTPVSTEPTPEGVETKYPTPANRLSPYIKSMDVGAFNIGFPLPDEVTAQELENKVKETKALKEARGETPTKETMRLSRETLFQTVNKMENLLNTIPSAEGIGGRISGVKERLSALSGYNPQLQVYNQFKQAVLGQVTKVLVVRQVLVYLTKMLKEWQELFLQNFLLLLKENFNGRHLNK